MSLPLPWIDKIFTKLTLVYGRDFIGRWEGLEIADVKTDWAHELSGFDKWPEAIAHALTNLPASKPPTVYEFRELARKTPAREVPMLPGPKPDMERVEREISKLRESMAKSPSIPGRGDWAYRILRREAGGERISPAVTKMARDGLKNLGLPELRVV